MTANATPLPIPRCSECGTRTVLAKGTGRTREWRRGVRLPVPETFEIPTCPKCGTEVLLPEQAKALDAELRASALGQQVEELRYYLRVLRIRHGATQRDVEDACAVTRSYFSHLLAGKRPASATLMRLVRAFALSPETFETIASGVALDQHLVGLFAVVPERTIYSNDALAKPRKGYEYEDGSLSSVGVAWSEVS